MNPDPYRATRMWIDLVELFRQGMPMTRHWQMLSPIDDCFSGKQGVKWLKKKLLEVPQFLPLAVSRKNCAMLIQKFIEAGIIDNISNKTMAFNWSDLYRLRPIPESGEWYGHGLFQSGLPWNNENMSTGKGKDGQPPPSHTVGGRPVLGSLQNQVLPSRFNMESIGAGGKRNTNAECPVPQIQPPAQIYIRYSAQTQPTAILSASKSKVEQPSYRSHAQQPELNRQHSLQSAGGHGQQLPRRPESLLMEPQHDGSNIKSDWPMPSVHGGNRAVCGLPVPRSNQRSVKEQEFCESVAPRMGTGERSRHVPPRSSSGPRPGAISRTGSVSRIGTAPAGYVPRTGSAPRTGSSTSGSLPRTNYLPRSGSIEGSAQAACQEPEKSRIARKTRFSEAQTGFSKGGTGFYEGRSSSVNSGFCSTRPNYSADRLRTASVDGIQGKGSTGTNLSSSGSSGILSTDIQRRTSYEAAILWPLSPAACRPASLAAAPRVVPAVATNPPGELLPGVRPSHVSAAGLSGVPGISAARGAHGTSDSGDGGLLAGRPGPGGHKYGAQLRMGVARDIAESVRRRGDDQQDAAWKIVLRESLTLLIPGVDWQLPRYMPAHWLHGYKKQTDCNLVELLANILDHVQTGDKYDSKLPEHLFSAIVDHFSPHYLSLSLHEDFYALLDQGFRALQSEQRPPSMSDLPNGCCLETAFTTQSPTTRIVRSNSYHTLPLPRGRLSQGRKGSMRSLGSRRISRAEKEDDGLDLVAALQSIEKLVEHAKMLAPVNTTPTDNSLTSGWMVNDGEEDEGVVHEKKALSGEPQYANISRWREEVAAADEGGYDGDSDSDGSFHTAASMSLNVTRNSFIQARHWPVNVDDSAVKFARLALLCVAPLERNQLRQLLLALRVVSQASMFSFRKLVSALSNLLSTHLPMDKFDDNQLRMMICFLSENESKLFPATDDLILEVEATRNLRAQAAAVPPLVKVPTVAQRLANACAVQRRAQGEKTALSKSNPDQASRDIDKISRSQTLRYQRQEKVDHIRRSQDDQIVRPRSHVDHIARPQSGNGERVLQNFTVNIPRSQSNGAISTRAKTNHIFHSQSESKVANYVRMQDDDAKTYCRQVSEAQFENQRLTGSQLALRELLEHIVNDPRMGSKEKRKRLKMFQESYPHLYHQRFPQECQPKPAAPKRGYLKPIVNSLKNLRI